MLVALAIPGAVRAAKINIAMQFFNTQYRGQMDPLAVPTAPGAFVDTSAERWNNLRYRSTYSWGWWSGCGLIDETVVKNSQIWRHAANIR